MAFMRTRVTFNAASGQTQDRVNLTMGWDTTESPLQLATDLATRFENLATSLVGGDIASEYATGYIPAFYEVFPATGGPATAVVDSPGTWVSSGTGSGPHEVALVVSYLIDTARGPSPRGRNYFGPLRSGRVQLPRPATDLMDKFVDFMGTLAGGMLTDGHRHMVLNAAGLVAWEVTGYRIDDAWDTQRRRGLDPTMTRTFPTT